MPFIRCFTVHYSYIPNFVNFESELMFNHYYVIINHLSSFSDTDFVALYRFQTVHLG